MTSLTSNVSVALEVCKAWFNENDASFLAKENIIVHWRPFNPTSKKGEWVKLKPTEVVRIIRATRSSMDMMKHVKPELLCIAAQELERMYREGVNTTTPAPEECFNFNRKGTFSHFQLLTFSILQTLVELQWNLESTAMAKVVDATFKLKGFVPPGQKLRIKLLDDVCVEAGIRFRHRKNRLLITGTGFFVAYQIEGLHDIKLNPTVVEIDSIACSAVDKYDAIANPKIYLSDGIKE